MRLMVICLTVLFFAIPALLMMIGLSSDSYEMGSGRGLALLLAVPALTIAISLVSVVVGVVLLIFKRSRFVGQNVLIGIVFGWITVIILIILFMVISATMFGVDWGIEV